MALALAALWGSNPVAIKIGLADAPPIRLACLRLVVGGVVVLVWAAVSGQLAALRIARHEWRPLLVLGALFTVQAGLLNIGTNLTTASHASILLNSYAVHTVVLAHFLIPGDHLTARKAAGILVAYAGAAILFARQWTAGTGTLAGDLMVALTAVLLAERTIYLARAVQRFDAVKLLVAQAVVGTGRPPHARPARVLPPGGGGHRAHRPLSGRIMERAMPTVPSKTLETVPNPHPDRDYEIQMTAPEFTCLCPITGQPDFATIRIRYGPDQHLVELKSLKLYLWSYRNEGAFHEDVTNRIMDDFVAAARPRWIEVIGDFSVRGGIKSEIRATAGKRPDIP